MRVRTLLVAVAVALAVGVTAGSASNSTTFQDSTGEDAAGPDITSIVVSNDDAGLISFQLNISNRPAFTPDMFFLVFVDTDSNASTGDPDSFGADYAIDLEPGTVGLFKWNGSDYTTAPSQTSLIYSYAATGPTVKVSSADLGGTRALKFVAIAFSGYVVGPDGKPDLSQLHRDFAPDAGHGLWPYQVVAKVVLKATAFTTSPNPAKAGTPFSVSMAVTQNTTNGPITSGTVLCAATIGGKRIAAASKAVVNGIATCLFRTQKTAKGKLLRGTIAVVVEGARLSRSFSARLT